MLLKKYR